MRRAGFAYRDPMQADDDPAFRTDRPSRREVAVALADVGCKQSVGLVAVWAGTRASWRSSGGCSTPGRATRPGPWPPTLASHPPG
jgi:hypothetical protein